LDLSDQKIRHCGDVFESRDLMGLTELNLNDNMISSIQTLRFLTNLVTLRLDNNSFENGSLLTTSLAISATHATLTSMVEEERQGNTIDSVPSTSERGLESLEVCVSQ
jgi:Leucine-rich repeat (LRR) protein